MYKVFIDNVPHEYDFEEEADLLREFKDHKLMEAAGGIVQSAEGFLFIFRNGLWDIPKGKLEKAETPEQAAVREVEEECGLRSPLIVKKLCDTWHTYPHKGKLVLKKTYWYAMKTNEQKPLLVPQTEEGITDLRFFERSIFDEVKGNTYLSIIDVMDRFENFLDR